MHYCLLVLAVLSFSTATEVLGNEDKAMEKNAVEETKMIPEKDLMWKEETKKGERRSEPPAYMFHMLEQFAKEGRRGYVRSILPMKGAFPCGIFQCCPKHNRMHLKKCSIHCGCLRLSGIRKAVLVFSF